MSRTIAIVLILILSVVFWIGYYEIFGERPEREICVVIVGFVTVCVFGTKSVVKRLRRKGKAGA